MKYKPIELRWDAGSSFDCEVMGDVFSSFLKIFRFSDETFLADEDDYCILEQMHVEKNKALYTDQIERKRIGRKWEDWKVRIENLISADFLNA